MSYRWLLNIYLVEKEEAELKAEIGEKVKKLKEIQMELD